MMNINKIWLLGMVLAGGLTLSACGGGGGGSDPTGDTGSEDTTDNSGEDTTDNDNDPGDNGGGTDDTVVSGSMTPLSGVAITPAKIRLAFQVSDSDGNPVTGLTEPSFENNFLIEQDGTDITTDEESFTEVSPARGLGFTIPSVFVLDISTSISDADLDKALASLREILIDETDPRNPVSLLEEEQSVALLVFDGNVTTELDLTQSPRQIQATFQRLAALDRQSRSDPSSTNLYGAALMGLDTWRDSFTTTDITQGYMILVTDGEDTSSTNTAEQVIGQREANGARIFTVPIGDIGAAAQDQLDELASRPEFAFETTDFEALGTEVAAIADTINGVLGSIYTLEYVASDRAGEHELSVTHITGEGEPSIKTVFSADNFSGQNREMVINQRAVINEQLLDPNVNIPLNETRVFSPETRWTLRPGEHVWSISQTDSANLVEVAQSGNNATVTASGDTYGSAKLQVEDQNNSNPNGLNGTVPVAETFNLYVTDTLVSAATRVLDFGQAVTLRGATLAQNDPSFSWSVTSSQQRDLCSLDTTMGDETTIRASSDPSVQFGTCEVTVTDAANGSSQYVLTMIVGQEGTPLPLSSPITANLFDFESSGGTPTSTGNWSIVSAASAGAPATSGANVLQANSIGHSQTTSFSVTVENFSSISFDYRVSSESGYDFLVFKVNGVVEFNESGETGWQEYEATGFGGTEATLTWEYSKDGTVDDGLDTAFIDNIAFE